MAVPKFCPRCKTKLVRKYRLIHMISRYSGRRAVYMPVYICTRHKFMVRIMRMFGNAQLFDKKPKKRALT